MALDLLGEDIHCIDRLSFKLRWKVIISMRVHDVFCLVAKEVFFATKCFQKSEKILK
jgi:hypothetical protein